MVDRSAGSANRQLEWERYCRLLCLLLFGVGAFLHLWLTPIFEKPDEGRHFQFAVHLAEGGALPVLGEEVGPWGQQGSQPPLYYWTSALLMRPFDLSPAEAVTIDNPHAVIGRHDRQGNKHYYMSYLLAPEHPAWHGTIWALYAGRLLSLVAGLVTVWAVWDIAAAIAPARARFPLALLATGTVALWPQWQFIASSFSNDAWTAMWSALVLREMAAVTRAERTVSLQSLLPAPRTMKLGLFIGAAALSKASGAGLLAVVVPWLFVEGWRRDGAGWWWTSFKPFALATGVAMLVAGWWYARNLLLYGDPFGFSAMILAGTMAVRDAPISWADVQSEWTGLRISFLALFGWFNIAVDDLAYHVWNLALLVGIAGAILQGWRFRRTAASRVAAWLLLWLLLMGLALIRWTLIIPASQGRLLFPALAAIFPLLALGWLAWIPSRYRVRVVIPFLLLLGLWSFSLPGRFLSPAYRPAELLDRLPAAAQAQQANFDDKMLLAGITHPPDWATPGSTLELTLYWKALDSMDERYSVSVKLLTPDGQVLAQDDSYPDGGRWPTTRWEAGRLIEDARRLRITDTVATPLAGRLVVEVFRYEDLATLETVATQTSTVQLGTVAIREKGYEPAEEAPFAFRPAVQDVTLNGESVEVDFIWEVGKPLVNNYQVFFHLVPGIGQKPIRQDDFEPLAGTFPTRHWLPGDRWPDQANLPLPAAGEVPEGEYRLLLGLYHLPTGERLAGEAGRNVWSVAELRFDGSRWHVE